MSAPRRHLAIVATLSCMAGPVWGCGAETPRGGHELPASNPKNEAIEAVNRFGDAPDVKSLLVVLGTTHRQVRESLGPHELRYTTTTRLEAADPADAEARSKLGRPILETFDVQDALVLQWQSGPADPIRARLRQENDKSDSRELVVIGDQVYTRVAPGGWFAGELDHDLHELWFDDAVRSVHDLAEFAAPALALGTVETLERGERELLRIPLRLSTQPEPDLRARGSRASWRRNATLTAVRGELLVDAQTGVWRQCELEVQWTMHDGADRRLNGFAHLSASLDPVDGPSLGIDAPADARPLAERVRYQVVENRLLDGLAAH